MVRRTGDGWTYERTLWNDGVGLVAGVDEAGRGAWAGPVVAAAVVLDPGPYPFVDSKSLSKEARTRLDLDVRRVARSVGVGVAEAFEVDELGVLVATKRAALRALAALEVQPQGLVTDYLELEGPWRCLAPVKADVHSVQAAAASIVAKVHRDRYMREVAAEAWPEYGFDEHVGYGTAAHRAALDAHGPCPAHRASFAPVRRARLLRTRHGTPTLEFDAEQG